MVPRPRDARSFAHLAPRPIRHRVRNDLVSQRHRRSPRNAGLVARNHQEGPRLESTETEDLEDRSPRARARHVPVPQRHAPLLGLRRPGRHRRGFSPPDPILPRDTVARQEGRAGRGRRARRGQAEGAGISLSDDEGAEESDDEEEGKVTR